MKITEIRTAEVRGHGYSCYVRISTDRGITGMGECIHGGAGIQQIIAALGSLIPLIPLSLSVLHSLRRPQPAAGEPAEPHEAQK